MTTFPIALGNETRKGLRVAWSERLQILIELPFFALFILLIGPVLGAGDQITAGRVEWSLSSETTSALVLWFVPFTVYYMQVVKLFWRLLGEIQAGTLEQVYLSPLPSWLVAAGARVVAALVESVLVAAGIYGIVSIFVPLHYHWTPAALLPVAMIVLTGTGVSLIVAGMTVVWKRVQLVNDGIMIVVMVASAGALPLLTVPGWMAEAGRFFPMTAPIGSLYGALLGDRGVTTPWGTGGLVWLLVTTAAYLAAGVLTFRLAERVAKTRGTLARY